jgi:response regulator RpfG family c-di-GMP phosphodiesterase
MEPEGRARVLCVDDEPHVLDGLARLLRRHYAVYTAVGADAALALLAQAGPFAVVVADLRMPGLDGVALLERVRALAPETVRLLLTGQADLAAAIGAVNQGQVFRFLTKPCPVGELLGALAAAVAQYRLITAERVLLEQTLRGSIQTLTDILAQVNPAAFGRAMRAKNLAGDLAGRCGDRDRWQIEVAAMLSQLGCVMLPAETVEKIYFGRGLSRPEQQMADRLPQIAERLLASIPRLEEVRRIILYQAKRFDGGGLPEDALKGEDIPWGARVLKVALDFDVLQGQGLAPLLALETMRNRAGWYDPTVLTALADLLGAAAGATEVREVALRTVQPGMVFAEDVKTVRGQLLIARGQEVTESLAERLRYLSPRIEIAEPVRVIVRVPPAAAVAGVAPAGAGGGPGRSLAPILLGR